MGTGEDHTFRARVAKAYGSNRNDEDRVQTSALCVSPSDDVVVVCRDETVTVYKKSGEEAGKLEGHRADVTCCSISQELLATASAKGIILLWKYRELKRVARIGLPGGPVNACSLSVSGRYLAVSYGDKKPRIYTLQGGDGSLLGGPTYKELPGHGSQTQVTDLKFSTMSDDNLMTAGKDGTIKFWKVGSGECIATIDLPEEGPILQVEFLKGTDIAILTEIGGFSIFNLDTCERVFNVPGKLKLLAGGGGTSMAALIDTTDTLYVYNLTQQKELLRKGTTHEGNILALVMCPSGTNFITSGADRVCYLWE